VIRKPEVTSRSTRIRYANILINLSIAAVVFGHRTLERVILLFEKKYFRASSSPTAMYQLSVLFNTLEAKKTAL
jgi:hypothetical protein